MGTVGSGRRPGQLRITSPAALGGVTLRLDDGRSVVGRSRSSQLQISYGDVSRTHAVIDHREGYTTVEDLGSMHGTAVNGISISQVHELHHGDEVRFGSVVAVFEESISPDAPTGRAERSWHAWTSGYWNRITKTILTAGALAGAIAAIVSVLPSSDPDPQDSARFAAVRLTPLVPLSEYRQRSGVMVPQGSEDSEGGQRDPDAIPQDADLAQGSDVKPSSSAGRLAFVRHVQQTLTTSSAGDPDTDTTGPEPPSSETTAPSSTTPSSTTTSSTTTSSTTSSSTTSSSASVTSSAPSMTGPPAATDLGVLSSSVQLAIPPAFQGEDLGEYVNEVLELVVAEDPSLVSEPSEVDSTTSTVPSDTTSTVPSDTTSTVPADTTSTVPADTTSTVPSDTTSTVPADTTSTVPSEPQESESPLVPIVVAMGASLDLQGRPVPPAVAAERLLQVLSDSRRSGGEPLGVVVRADLELFGLRGKPVLLSWSMWQQGGSTRLYGDWLNTNLAYKLEATTDHDTTTLDLWIPLPSAPGPYFIRLLLADDESTLASADSDPFN